MRDIKFRLWNDEDNKMERVTEMRQFLAVSEKWECNTICDETETESEWCVFKNIMQFTGLTDKNGTDIYEGDIVSSDYYFPDIKCVAAIKYNADSMSFAADDGEQDAYKYGRLVVIGNIYENPELLGEE